MLAEDISIYEKMLDETYTEYIKLRNKRFELIQKVKSNDYPFQMAVKIAKNIAENEEVISKLEYKIKTFVEKIIIFKEALDI